MLDAFQRLLGVLDHRKFQPHRIAAALVSSFMLSYVFQLLRYGGFGDLNDYINHLGYAEFFIIAIIAFAFQAAFTLLLRQPYIVPWALMFSTVAVSIMFAVSYTGDNAVYFGIGLALLDFIVVVWEVRGDKLGVANITVSQKAAFIAACVLFGVTTIAFGYLTSLKYRSYSNFTFDFGIFAQMYERMASTGAPLTTVERSYMMSHFGVHFSPIFYLFLPGYFIFRTPIYLFYVQSAAVAGGVFAVYLIAAKMKLSGKMILALELMYAFYPCLFNGTFYDFHENKFLTTIILFLFYFIISYKTPYIYIFSLLLLSVKEDAAIYLIVIAIYVIMSRKEGLRGFLMLMMALIYFILAQQVVAAMGTEGVMMSRLSDFFINGEQTFGSVIKAIFYDMGYLIQQMFTAEKLPFIIWMFLPVIFTPFMNRRIANLVLLLPIIPINLMQSWKYQFDVNYQYTYGVAALIIMSAIFVIIRLDANKKRAVVMTSVCVCIVMSTLLVAPKVRNVTSYMKNTEETRPLVDQLIEEVPADATVTASHSLVPHLYKVEWLYTMPDYYPQNRDKPTDTDYFVIDTRYSDLANEMKNVMGDDYTLVSSAGFAELYQHK